MEPIQHVRGLPRDVLPPMRAQNMFSGELPVFQPAMLASPMKEVRSSLLGPLSACCSSIQVGNEEQKRWQP